MAGLVAAVLTVTACGDGSSDDSPTGGAPSASAAPPVPSSGSSPDATDGRTGGTSAAGDLDGSWLATTDGKAVVLTVDGRQAALFTTGGSLCSGSVGGGRSDSRVIELTCPDDTRDRAEGTVESVDGSHLVMRWESLGRETYVKAENGRFPSALATATEGLDGAP